MSTILCVIAALIVAILVIIMGLGIAVHWVDTRCLNVSKNPYVKSDDEE